MAGAKEIRTQIKSIKNTQKITKAMEMVAASKMRKAQDRMRASRPYADKMKNVVAHMGKAHPEYKHPYLIERDAKRVGLIVISTDRGLCGGLNINLFKQAVMSMKEWQGKNLEIDVAVIGTKAMGFFKRLGGNVVSENSHLGDTPRIEELIGSVKVMLDALLMRYVESLVYQGLVENIACEMAARMVAMKAATDNAGNLIGELQLVYNKARQAAITQELSEIVSGAAAV